MLGTPHILSLHTRLFPFAAAFELSVVGFYEGVDTELRIRMSGYILSVYRIYTTY